MPQPEKPSPHPRIDGLTGEETRHPQVPLFYYTVDEQIADLISIMNYYGIHTINSCQDNRYNRGDVPRVWVEILAEHYLLFLTTLDQPDEAGNAESLSRRMVPELYPDIDYQENRAWHYRPQIQRVNGQVAPLTISVRFPLTDLPEVVTRLRAAAKDLGFFAPRPREPAVAVAPCTAGMVAALTPRQVHGPTCRPCRAW
jgi:hypothetical protein